MARRPVGATTFPAAPVGEAVLAAVTEPPDAAVPVGVAALPPVTVAQLDSRLEKSFGRVTEGQWDEMHLEMVE